MKRSLIVGVLFLPLLVFAEDMPNIRYEPGNVLPLPFQNCEVRTQLVTRPFDFELPVSAKIYLYLPENDSKSGPILTEKFTKPTALESGHYLIEVEGRKEPIYLAYKVPVVLRRYTVIRSDSEKPVGSFIIPGTARLPVGTYHLKFQEFDVTVQCRDKERAVIDLPGYEGLPPMIAPGSGIAW